MLVEEHETTCSSGAAAPLTVPTTTFAKVTGGDDSEDAQAAAGSTVLAPRRPSTQVWCSPAWTSLVLPEHAPSHPGEVEKRVMSPQSHGAKQ